MNRPAKRILFTIQWAPAVLMLALALAGCGQPDDAQVTPTTIPEATAMPPTQEPPTPTTIPTATEIPIININASNVSQLGQVTSIEVSDTTVVAAVLSPVAPQLATFDADRYVRIWDTASGAKLHEMGPHAAQGFGLAYSPDGNLLASGGGFEVIIWDAVSGAQMGSITTGVFVFRLVWSPDGRRIAVVGDSSSHIPIIDAITGELIDQVDTPLENVLWSVAFSPNGKLMAVGDYQGNITVFHMPDKKIVYESKEGSGSPWDIEFSPDGSLLATCNGSGGIYAWDTSTWTLNPNLTKLDAHDRQAGCADGAFSADSSVYFSAGLDHRLVEWNIATGEKLGEQTIGSAIWTASMSADGTTLALALDNGKVRILGLDATAAITPEEAEAPTDIIEIDDVPTYPGITATVAYDALEVPRKCGGTIFRHFDVYYSVDYGGDLTKEEKMASPLNQQIMDFFREQFAADDWIGFDIIPPQGAVLDTVFWEEENRSYPAGASDPPFVGSCYLATILIQPPGADLEIIADVK
jgi:WD40 repeat protein